MKTLIKRKKMYIEEIYRIKTKYKNELLYFEAKQRLDDSIINNPKLSAKEIEEILDSVNLQ